MEAIQLHEIAWMVGLQMKWRSGRLSLGFWGRRVAGDQGQPPAAGLQAAIGAKMNMSAFNPSSWRALNWQLAKAESFPNPQKEPALFWSQPRT